MVVYSFPVGQRLRSARVLRSEANARWSFFPKQLAVHVCDINGNHMLTNEPTEKQKLLPCTTVFELVDNDCTNDNAPLDDLLPVGRHIHQVEGIV
jgi:hypothetical protein